MKRFFLAIIFCLFLGSVANAQSAWVLWKRVSHNLIDKEGKWELKIAFPTYNECLEVKESELRDTGKTAKAWKEVMNEENQGNRSWVRINPGVNVIVWDEKESKFTIYEYNCFPDTIDPRK
jgi:hypothetical protein